MLSVGLLCRSILGAETRNTGAALHILCRRESETRCVLVEGPLLVRADRHAAKYFRFTGGTAASNTDTFVLKSDEAHIRGGSSRQVASDATAIT